MRDFPDFKPVDLMNMPDHSSSFSERFSSLLQASDTELVEDILAGHEDAFRALMKRYNQLLFRTARSVMKSDADAEDVVQNAYIHAWRGLKSFQARSRLSTWLVRITLNEAYGRLRRKSAKLIELDTAMRFTDTSTQDAFTDHSRHGPQDEAMRDELRSHMEARIDQLPEGYRTVFILRALHELSMKEISDMLEMPEATVRTRYFRARAMLREKLQSDIDITLADAFSFDGERCDRLVANTLEQLKKEHH